MKLTVVPALQSISILLVDTVPPCPYGFSSITWPDAERCKTIAVKECLCPFSPSQAYKSNVYAHPPEYVNNSEVMQGIVLAAPLSGNEKVC